MSRKNNYVIVMFNGFNGSGYERSHNHMNGKKLNF